MREDTKQQANIIARIRKLILNFELSIEYAKAEIKLREADMKLFESSLTSPKKKSYRKQQYLNAKIDKEKLEIYLYDVTKARDELHKDLDRVLNNYRPIHKQVIKMFFFEDKTYQEIADTTHYSFDFVKDIISNFKRDILNYYLP